MLSMVTRSTYPGVVVPDGSIAQFVCERHEARAAKPALIDGSTDRVITYAELRDDVKRVSAGLQSLGVKRGDVVAVFAPNSPDYVALFYGVTSTGAVITSLNVIHNVAELSYQLIDSGARILVMACEPTPALRAAIRKAKIATVLQLDDVRTAGTSPGRVVHVDGWRCRIRGGVNHLHQRPQRRSHGGDGDPPQPGLEPAPDQECRPDRAERGGSQPDAVLPAVWHGGRERGTARGRDRRDIPLFQARMAAHCDARSIASRPRISCRPSSERWPSTPRSSRFDLSALRKITSMTAPLPESVGRACAERLHCSVSQAYGLTEAVALTHFTPRQSGKIASLGVPVPDTECRIVDVASREDVQVGELGEVWVRGPQVMKGYHNNPEVTADVIDGDGWLRTSDIGYVDADGYLFVVDRSKKLARLRGLHRQDGELLRAAIEDIAARLKAADKLRVQSVVLNSVRESVLSTDLGNRVTFWNKGAEQLFGYSAEEAMGKHVASLIVPDGVNFVAAGKTDELRSKGTWSSQVMRRRKDGSIIWTDVMVSVVTDAGGQRSGYLGIHRDVTEQRKVEERLRFQAQLLDSVYESVVATDLEDRVTFWARGAETLFGYSAGEMLGMSLAPLAFPDDPDPAEALRRIREEVIRTGSWNRPDGPVPQEGVEILGRRHLRARPERRRQPGRPDRDPSRRDRTAAQPGARQDLPRANAEPGGSADGHP